jgi:hypothetical protein
MDLSAAQLFCRGDEVDLVDPDFPFTVRAKMDPFAAVPTIRSLTVEARGECGVNGAALITLPVRQLASVAASAVRGEGEAQYRMLAIPRPEGARSWPDDHYARVARVALWARATGRPGGEAGAVSEFWGVHLRTARRWIARALR